MSKIAFFWRERSSASFRIMEGLAAVNTEPKTVMIDATDVKARRTASSLRVKRDVGRLIGRTKGGLNTKLHAVADYESSL